MDDLREKLAKLHGVAWLKPTGVVTIHFDPDTDQAEQAYDAIMVVKDAWMPEPGWKQEFAEAVSATPPADPDAPTVQTFGSLGRINEEALDDTRAYDAEIDAPIKGAGFQAGALPSHPIDRAEILRRGVVLDDIDGDTMTHVMDKLGWPRPGFPMGKVATHKLVPIDEPTYEQGYNAARPLDPGTIYVSQELTREEERAAAGLSNNFTSPPVPPGSAWQPTDDAMRINPVEDAIMPELRESLYDETAAIAAAAGEGMGVACEKPE